MVPKASRTQAKGWLLVLLVLGHEAQLVAGGIGANASNSTEALRHDLFAAPKWLDTATLRRLQVALGGDWNWPVGSSLLFSWKKGTGQAIEVVQTKGVSIVEVVASLVYDKMEISTEDPNTPIGAAHTAPAVKLVRGTADRTLCQSTAFDVPVGQDASGNAGDLGITSGALSLTNSGNLLTNSQVNVIFMQGGQYKLCYTPDGTFGGNDGSEVNNNVVATMIKVYGVSGPCLTDGCLKDERWECWFGYKGESVPSHCQFNFQYDGGRVGWGIETGTASRLTWTPAYGADTVQGGVVTYSSQLCAANDADLSLFDLAAGVSRYMDITSQSTATMPAVKSTHSSAFTMAACYCPNYDAERGEHCSAATNTCCDSFAEFIQQFGVIYFWTVRVCDYQYYTTCMPLPTGSPPSYRYMRVVPQQKFTLRIDCPPGGGCTTTNDNRVNFIGQLPSNDRPSWDANAGCRTYTASISAVWPSAQDAGAVGGGTSLLYKAWRDKQVKINLSLKRGLDVCYCNANPSNPSSWFKVGTVSTTNAFAFASQTLPTGGAITPIESIKYVGHPGSVTLYGGVMGLDPSLGNFPSPFESNMYSGKAVINVMSFDREIVDGQGALQRTLMEQFSYDAMKPLDFQEQMDTQCQKERYSLTLVTGPSSKQAARSYVAQVDATSDNTPSQYHSFSGSGKDQKMTVNLAGVVAICYCGMVTAENECQSSLNWLFAGLMTIQGPEGGRTFIFPTNVVVKFDLKGWGFSPDDRLRIIPANAECSGTTQSPNNPDSDVSFKVDCPAINGQGCRQATTSESIDTSVLTSNSAGVGIYIDQVSIQQTSTTLRFTGDITPYLGRDDEFGADIITLDLDRIMVNGKDINSVSAIERHEANKLAGVYEYQDTYTNGPIQTYQVGHRVMSTPNNNQMSIPQGWIPTAADGEFYFSTSPFTFLDSKGHWTRRNKLETREEIKGITAAPNLKLCWGIYSAGETKFYHEAGKVNFVDPPAMASAVVSLTTKMQEAVAPVIIAFKTTESRNEYSTPTGATMLMLRFLDVSRKFEPYWHNQENGIRGVYSIPDTQEVTQTASKQQVCGKIFLEFWSSHSEGFPMPTGCHLTQKLSDQPVNGGSDFFREIYITFGEGNGLRQGVDYHIVLNSRIMLFNAGEQLVDIYAMCAGFTGCERPYQVFEKGSATASQGTVVPATASEPQFALQDGFTLQRGNPMDGVVNLSELNILQFRLRAGVEARNNIVNQCLIRMFMWPLTVWNVGTSTCMATCIADAFYNARCNGIVGCDPEEVVVNSGRRNIVKITLPTEMDAISTEVMHTIQITSLTLPTYGFFPTKIGVQLTKPDDNAPHYITSAGYIMKNPDAGATNGRIVISDRSGYGPKPFQSDVSNILYLRIQLGATLWNVGRQNTAFLTINLPTGYGACNVVGTGAPDQNLKVFLQKTDGYVDNNRGVLAVSNDDGDWANSNIRTCTYELFTNNQAIYAGMVFYVAVTVVNPTTPLPKTDPENVLTIKLSGLGQYDPQGIAQPPPYDFPDAPFISLGEEKTLGQDYWAGNPSVITVLTEELVQPYSFVRSCCGPNFETRRAEDFLRVFFFTSTYIGQNGYVVFDAPSGFNFDATCTARDLPERYYAFVGQFQSRLYRLKNMGSCTGKKFPTTDTTFNRAQLQVGGIIDAPYYYGYEVRVLHPTTYDTTQHSTWYLWLMDSNAYVLQGSQETMRFNKFNDPALTSFYDLSWGMYDDVGPDIPVQLLSTRPTSLTNAKTEVIFFPISFQVDLETSLRVSAPPGFKWDVDPNAFFRRTNGTLEDWPTLPTILNQNQLVFNTLSLKGNTQYGFRAQADVPDFNPVIAANSFFIEFGYKSSVIQQRRFANVVEAPSIAALTNAEVYSSTNLVNYADNRIEFAVQTVTTLTANTGIVVKGSDLTTGFMFTCPTDLVALPESAPFPTDLICVYQVASDGAPQITLKVGDDGSESAHTKASDYPTTPVLDEVQRDATNRNDRPGKSNQLIFLFSLNIWQPAFGQSYPDPARAHRLVKSRGSLRCELANIQMYRPTKCTGVGREAQITIPGMWSSPVLG